MSPAGPVEVFLLKVLLAAELANLLVDVKVAAVLQFLDALPHLVALVLEHLNELVRFREFVLELGRLFRDLL